MERLLDIWMSEETDDERRRDSEQGEETSGYGKLRIEFEIIEKDKKDRENTGKKRR